MSSQRHNTCNLNSSFAIGEFYVRSPEPGPCPSRVLPWWLLLAYIGFLGLLSPLRILQDCGVFRPSNGGATIMAVGVDERVIGLVYVAAVAPDAGETVQDPLDKYPWIPLLASRSGRAPGCFRTAPGFRRRLLRGRPEARHYAPVFDFSRRKGHIPSTSLQGRAPRCRRSP